MNKKSKLSRNPPSQNCFNIFSSFQELVEIDNSLLLNVNQLKCPKADLEYDTHRSIMSIGTQEESLYKNENNVTNYLGTDSGILRLGLQNTNFQHMNPMNMNSNIGFYYNHYYNHGLQNDNLNPNEFAEPTHKPTKLDQCYDLYEPQHMIGYDFQSYSSFQPSHESSTDIQPYYGGTLERPYLESSFSQYSDIYKDISSAKFEKFHLPEDNLLKCLDSATEEVLDPFETESSPTFGSQFLNTIYGNDEVVPGLVRSDTIRLSSPKKAKKPIQRSFTTPLGIMLSSSTKLENTRTSSSLNSKNIINKVLQTTQKHDISCKFTTSDMDIFKFDTSFKNEEAMYNETIRSQYKSLSCSRENVARLVNPMSKCILKPKLNLRINTLDFKLMKLFSDNKNRILFEKNKAKPRNSSPKCKSLDFLYLNSLEYFNSELGALEKYTSKKQAKTNNESGSFGSGPTESLFLNSSKKLISSRRSYWPSGPRGYRQGSASITCLERLATDGGNFDLNTKLKSLFFDDNLVYQIPEKMKMRIVSNLLVSMRREAAHTKTTKKLEIFRFYGNSIDTFFASRVYSTFILNIKKAKVAEKSKCKNMAMAKIKKKSENKRSKPIKFIFALNSIKGGTNPESIPGNKVLTKNSTNDTVSDSKNKKMIPNLSIDGTASKKPRRSSLKSELEFVYIQTEAANEAAKYNFGTTKLYIHNKDITKDSSKKVLKSRITSIPSQIREIPDLGLEAGLDLEEKRTEC